MPKKSEADWKKEQEFAKATVKLTMTPAEILDAVVEDDFRFAVENDDYIKDLIRRSMEDDTEEQTLEMYMDNVFDWEEFRNGTQQ